MQSPRPRTSPASIVVGLVLTLALLGGTVALFAGVVVWGTPCESGGSGSCGQPLGQVLLALAGVLVLIVGQVRFCQGEPADAATALLIAAAVFAGWGFAFDSVFH
jgi:hypothetical protein